MADFTHFNEQGRAKMVDVGEKPVTVRTAVAAGRVLVNEQTKADTNGQEPGSGVAAEQPGEKDNAQEQ